MLTLLQSDALAALSIFPSEYFQCCITSPPYYGLRDYEEAGQLGLEASPDEYVDQIMAVFGEVRRVLREDGTCWLNLGDAYANDTKWGGTSGNKNSTSAAGGYQGQRSKRITGLKPKDLIGIPWRVAFALQADGWWLRSEIIWNKPNAMPSSVKDRPTSSHEHIFLLTKSQSYQYDWKAIVEPFADARQGRDGAKQSSKRNVGGRIDGYTKPNNIDPSKNGGRNKRSVWSVNTQPYKGPHFATFPEALIEPCVLAGSKPGDKIIDPFCGTGTVGLLCAKHGREFVGIDLSIKLAVKRLTEAGHEVDH